MSGVEIFGVLLGAFPLCISAMEHYEETKRVAGTFLKIRRAHRRDLGKIKDCQLLFKLNLKELLLPLLHDETVDKMEYELLLLHPGGPAWKNGHIESALKERLYECHDRYLEILSEMRETMTELCESTKVDDTQFQQRLKARKFAKGPSDDANQAREELIQRANRYVTFQAKRAQYTFAASGRDTLLEQLEAQNNKLQSILTANDRVAATGREQRPAPARSTNSRALRFWRHANDIYSILKTTWHCTCRSCLNLWLQHHVTEVTQMNLVVPFCHGRRSVNVRLKDTPTPFRLSAPSSSKAGKRPIRPYNGPTTVSIHAQATTFGAVTVASGQQTSTLTYVSQSQASTQTATGQSNTQNQTLQLEKDGLCRVFSCNTTMADCIGTVLEGDHEYAVYPAAERVPMAQGTSLADLLRPDSQIRLTRVQRYGISLTLASSHLQLHSTPWLSDSWTSEEVFFPTSQTNVAVLHGEPYILAQVESTQISTQTNRKDRSFSTLGIVLLELCFGCRLEDHKMWQNPGYAPLKNDPLIRQTVACEWLYDVQGEAGEDYANAVNWTLHQAPAVLKDEKWREDFAQNVVQPLQRYYEYLHPTKSS